MVVHKTVSVKTSANTVTLPATNDVKQEDFLLDEQAVTLVSLGTRRGWKFKSRFRFPSLFSLAEISTCSRQLGSVRERIVNRPWDALISETNSRNFWRRNDLLR